MSDVIDWLRLKRLASVDPFAAKIRSQVKFPTSKLEPTYEPPPIVSPTPSAMPSMGSAPRIQEYMSYLNSEPRREDYKAGKVAKALAAISGTIEGAFDSPSRGISTYKGITDMPFIQAREDWERKGSRLKEMADLEYRGLDDDEKRMIQRENLRLRSLQEIRQWAKTQSDIKYTESQMNNIENQIKNRGLSVEKNEVSGQLEVVDKINGGRTSLGQFAESVKDKDTRARNMFKYQSGVTEERMSRMQEDAQAAALNLESIRTLNDSELIRFRHTFTREDKELERKLEGMSTAAQKTALELAYQQADLDFPTLKVDDPSKFMTEIRKRLKNIRERTKTDVETIIGDEDPLKLFED